MRFKVRFGSELGNTADAEIGDWRYVIRNGQQPLQRLSLDDAHPADANALGTRGQPEILHRADGAVEIHLRIVPASQRRTFRALPVASDADVERALADAFQLELAVQRLFFRLDRRQFLLARGQEQVAHPFASLDVTNDNEIPWLHEADRWRMMGGKQQPRQHVVIDRGGQEMAAHVAPREHGAIDRIARILVESIVNGSGHMFRHRLSPCDCRFKTVRAYFVRPNGRTSL
ncbi:hypothetical protein A4R29_08050 [Mesorhizobium ciceri biovar biserrulae]|nr:hypothetical protein A4R29_08050 [Mesorhizobium ciceri biovar biserrulae]